jgi:hypothetical protein
MIEEHFCAFDNTQCKELQLKVHHWAIFSSYEVGSHWRIKGHAHSNPHPAMYPNNVTSTLGRIAAAASHAPCRRHSSRNPANPRSCQWILHDPGTARTAHGTRHAAYSAEKSHCFEFYPDRMQRVQLNTPDSMGLYVSFQHPMHVINPSRILCRIHSLYAAISLYSKK